MKKRYRRWATFGDAAQSGLGSLPDSADNAYALGRWLYRQGATQEDIRKRMKNLQPLHAHRLHQGYEWQEKRGTAVRPVAASGAVKSKDGAWSV